MPRRLPEVPSPVIMARFPFLPQGEEWIKSLREQNGIGIEDLFEGEWLESVRGRGNLRLLESIKHDDGIDSVTPHDIYEPYGQMVEGIGFYYAMLIVCASFDEALMKRWVEGEASRADKLLGSSVDSETFELVARTYLSDIRQDSTSQNQGSVHATRREETVYQIPMADFIELCPSITGSYWRLVNRPLKDGWVTMDASKTETSRERLARLIKERIRRTLVERCQDNSARMDEEFAAKLADPVGKMMAELQSQRSRDIQVTEVHEGDWPPCMMAAINDLSRGENVNHAGRRFLANMSRAIGLDQEQVHSFFVNAPDYNAETTKYQLSQLYEGKYTPEKCDTLKLHARCPVASGVVDDRLCRFEWLTHPLKYTRAKQRRRVRDEPQEIPQPTAEPSSEDNG